MMRLIVVYRSNIKDACSSSPDSIRTFSFTHSFPNTLEPLDNSFEYLALVLMPYKLHTGNQVFRFILVRGITMPVTLSTKSADCDTASEPSNNLEEAGHSNDSRGCRRIQVSREKRPIHFFISLAKKFLCTDNVVELSGLGLAVTTVVTIVERLREEHLVHIKGKKHEFILIAIDSSYC